jgi:hypothetical protein
MDRGNEGANFPLDSALVFLRLVDVFPPCPTLLPNTLKNAEEGGWGNVRSSIKPKNMDGNIALKRQVSDFQLTAIRGCVGLIVTILICALSVAWTCGFFASHLVILSQFQEDAFYYGFVYTVFFWLNIGVFYNMVEFLLWRFRMRSDFVPKIPPSELNDEWTIISKEEWLGGVKVQLFLWIPLWFFFVSWIFSHHAQRFCSIP